MAQKIPFTSLPDAIKKRWGKKAWDDTDAELQQKVFQSVKESMSSAQRRTSKYTEPDQIDFDNDDLGTLSDIASARQRDADVTMGAYKQLIKDGQFFALDGPFIKGLGEAIRQQNIMFAQPKEGAEAYMTMAMNVQQFNKLTAEAFNKTGNFTAKLADQAATLKKLGLRQGEFSQNLETAIYDMGMNQKGVEDFNMSIKKLSEGLDMLPDQVSRNFRQVAQNLMYDSATIKEEYAKLETLAQKTGLSATDLAGQFGSRMDTISGASSAASNLNAMLGRNAFSATQLLGMTESERAEAIREAIQGDSNLMGDIQSGGASGKFAMISVAEALGMDRKTARRFISTGEAGSVKSKIEEGVKADTGAGMNASVLVENFKKPSKDLKGALDRLREQVELTLNPTRVALLQNRRAQLARAESGDYQMLERAGRMGRIGMLTGDVTQAQYAEISRSPSDLALFDEIQRREQQGTVESGTSANLARALTGTQEERAAGLAAARKAVKRKVDIDEQLKQAGTAISPLVASILTRVLSANRYGGRVMFKAALNYLRDEKNPPMTIEVAKDFEERAKAIDEEMDKGKAALQSGKEEDFKNLEDLSEGSVLQKNLPTEVFNKRKAAAAAAPSADSQRAEADRLASEIKGLSKNKRIKSSDLSKSGNNWTMVINLEGDEALRLDLEDVRGQARVNTQKRRKLEDGTR